MIPNPTEAQQKAFNIGMGAYDSLINLYSRDVNINNTTITQKVTGIVRTKCQLSTNMTNKLVALQTHVAKEVATQKIAMDYGLNAQDPQLKAIISNNQQLSDSSSSSSIQNAVTKAQSSVSVGTSIIIESNGQINLNNVKFDQDVVCTVITEAILNQAIENGLQAAASMTSEISSDQVGDVKAAGLDDLMKVLGDNNANAIKSNKSDYTMVLVVVAVIVVVMVIGGGFYAYQSNNALAEVNRSDGAFSQGIQSGKFAELAAAIKK